MAERILFVDYENVQALDVAKIPADVRLHVVLGAKQKATVAKVTAKTKSLGERVTITRIKTLAPNAVDFCIAYYLGEEFVRNPKAQCVVLSKDKKGFDPLALHLTKERRFQVRRVNAQKEAFPVATTTAKTKRAAASKAVPPPVDHYGRLLKLLGKEKVLPLKLKGLNGKLKSWFPTVSAEDRHGLERRLLADGLVCEANGTLTFHLQRTGSAPSP